MRGTEWKFIERRWTARVQQMPCVGGLPGLKLRGLGQAGIQVRRRAAVTVANGVGHLC